MFVIDIVALWIGRIIVWPIIVLVPIIMACWLYRHLFVIPRCPDCHSKSEVTIIEWNGPSWHCRKCHNAW